MAGVDWQEEGKGTPSRGPVERALVTAALYVAGSGAWKEGSQKLQEEEHTVALQSCCVASEIWCLPSSSPTFLLFPLTLTLQES